MGNPVNDKTITSHHSHMGAPDRDRVSDRLGQGKSKDACHFFAFIWKASSTREFLVVISCQNGDEYLTKNNSLTVSNLV